MNTYRHEKARRLFRITAMALAVIVVIAVTVGGVLWVNRLSSDQDMLQSFQEQIRSLGPGGWLVLFFIQYFQIVVAFIPGGPIQLIAGALFGPLGGMLICLSGTVAASLSIFTIIRRFGPGTLHFFVNEDESRKFRFLRDAKRLEYLAMILFLIPGTPKDVLTYLFALTPIPIHRFMVIATAARIPAMLTSVLTGDSIAEGRWLHAALLFLGISAVSLGGLLLYRKVIAPLTREHK